MASGAEGGRSDQEMVEMESSFLRQEPVSAKPHWALLEKAVQLKTLGNSFYKDKNIRLAISRYHRALLVLRSMDSEVLASVRGFGSESALTPEQETLLRNTQVDCYNNLAACLLLKQDIDYTRVLEYSQKVLQRQPGNIKALYRAGLACLEIGDARSAKKHFTLASQKQPNDANIRKQLQRAEEKLQELIQREKEMYQCMFPSKLNNGIENEIDKCNIAGDKA